MLRLDIVSVRDIRYSVDVVYQRSLHSDPNVVMFDRNIDASQPFFTACQECVSGTQPALLACSDTDYTETLRASSWITWPEKKLFIAKFVHLSSRNSLTIEYTKSTNTYLVQLHLYIPDLRPSAPLIAKQIRRHQLESLLQSIETERLPIHSATTIEGTGSSVATLISHSLDTCYGLYSTTSITRSALYQRLIRHDIPDVNVNKMKHAALLIADQLEQDEDIHRRGKCALVPPHCLCSAHIDDHWAIARAFACNVDMHIRQQTADARILYALAACIDAPEASLLDSTMINELRSSIGAERIERLHRAVTLATQQHIDGLVGDTKNKVVAAGKAVTPLLVSTKAFAVRAAAALASNPQVVEAVSSGAKYAATSITNQAPNSTAARTLQTASEGATHALGALGGDKEATAALTNVAIKAAKVAAHGSLNMLLGALSSKDKEQ